MKRAPVSLLAIAVGLWAVYAVVRICGLRNELSALSLTPPPGEQLETALLGAGLYLAAWWGGMVIAPILALAGAGLKAAEQLARTPIGSKQP
jgi:hypothetical protein